MKNRFKDTLVFGMRDLFHNWKLLPLFWFVNAIGAILLTLPIYHLLVENLTHSLIAETLTQGFDYTWFIQFKNLYESNFEQMPFIIYSVAGVYALVQTFFLGGLIAVFNNPQKNHIVDFFYGGVKYWYRFTKVVLISLVFFALAFVANDYLGNVISWTFEGTENEMTDFILRSLRYVFLVFHIGAVTIFSDYTKVSMAINDEINVRKGILDIIKFFRRNFFTVFSVFLFIAIVGALGSILYNIIEAFIPRTPFYFLIVAFILQQLLVIFRLFIRMFFCSTEVILYKDLNADVAEVDVVVERKEKF